MYLSAAPVALVPEMVVTVTSTEPAAPAGAVTVSEVPPPLTMTFVPGVDPKVTAVAPEKVVPVTVTVLPPARGPPEGFTAVTVGIGGGAWTTRSIANPELAPAENWEDVGCTAPEPTAGL